MSIVEHLTFALTNLESGGKPEAESESIQALRLAKSIVQKLERPEDVVRHYGREVSTQQMSLRFGVDMGIFDLLAKSDTPITAEDLAGKIGAETLFVIRIMRVLTATGFATEVKPQTFLANSVTHAVNRRELQAIVRVISDSDAPIMVQLPKHLKKRGYKCPTDAMDCPLQWTFGTQLNYFGWLAAHPEQERDLALSMMVQTKATSSWTDFYPVRERLLNEFDNMTPEAALLVDVGGGAGFDLKEFVEKFPESKGHLILQDLPSVVEAIEDTSIQGIAKMSHDFFNDQPIEGAKAYFTHRVLHDWGDPTARIILEKVKKSMKRGYSRLLLNETILPEINCPLWDAVGDLNMMCILGGVKRSRGQWNDLIESAGLKVEKIWTSEEEDQMDGIIEVVCN